MNQKNWKASFQSLFCFLRKTNKKYFISLTLCTRITSSICLEKNKHMKLCITFTKLLKETLYFAVNNHSKLSKLNQRGNFWAGRRLRRPKHNSYCLNDCPNCWASGQKGIAASQCQLLHIFWLVQNTLSLIQIKSLKDRPLNKETKHSSALENFNCIY